MWLKVMLEVIITWQPISSVYGMTSYQRDDDKHRKESTGKLFFLSVWDLTAVAPERPNVFKKGPAQPHWVALPLVGSVDRRVEVRGNNRATGSEAGWSTYRSNEALLPNLRAQRHREVLFTLYSRFSVEFSSVESSCIAIDWFLCLYSWSHFSHINIIIEIYRVVVFLLWSPPGPSPAGPHRNIISLEESDLSKKPQSEDILSVLLKPFVTLAA